MKAGEIVDGGGRSTLGMEWILVELWFFWVVVDVCFHLLFFGFALFCFQYVSLFSCFHGSISSHPQIRTCARKIKQSVAFE